MSLIAVITVLGWVGAAAAIVAYGMVSRGRWGAGSFAFQLTNVGATTTMFLVAVVNGVWPSAAANVAGMVIGIHATVTIARKRAEARAGAVEPAPLVVAPDVASERVHDLVA